jgi:transposase-like protein
MRGDKNAKATVLGVVERKGRVICRTAVDTTSKTLHGFVKEYVLPKSTVFTDDFVSYHGLDRIDGMDYQHRRINHSASVYVMGDVHTQTIEGFWSLVKRGIGGVYHSVSQKYLQTYLDEYSFRYNRRASGNLIFPAMLAKVGEKALLKPFSPAPKIQTV